MDPGAAGASIILLFGIVGATVTGIYTIAYASHCFLTIAEQTSSGAEEIQWPDEPMLDWLWKGAYLLWLCALWLAPALIIGRKLIGDGPGMAASFKLTVVATVLFWLWMPVTLLSAQLGPSRWVVFWPPAVATMMRCIGSVVIFYLMTGPLLALGGACVYYGFFKPWYWITITIPVLGALWLIYARLYGRLAHILEDFRRKNAPEEVEDEIIAPVSTRRARRPRRQPRDLPPINTPDEEARTGYDVNYSEETPPEPEMRYQRPFDYDPEGYGLREETPAEQRRPITIEPSEREMAYASKKRRPDVPEMPWLNDTVTVVFQEALMGAWMWLSAWLFGFAFMARLCRGG